MQKLVDFIKREVFLSLPTKELEERYQDERKTTVCVHSLIVATVYVYLFIMILVYSKEKLFYLSIYGSICLSFVGLSLLSRRFYWALKVLPFMLLSIIPANYVSNLAGGPYIPCPTFRL